MGGRVFGRVHGWLLVDAGILATAILGVGRLSFWLAIVFAVVAAGATYDLARRIARLEAEARIPEWKKREDETVRGTYLGSDSD